MSADRITRQDPRFQYPGPACNIEIRPFPGTDASLSERHDCGTGRAAAIEFTAESANVAISCLPEAQEASYEQSHLVSYRRT
jgi:hypothetical protein